MIGRLRGLLAWKQPPYLLLSLIHILIITE